jgi:hypothetical protein
METLRETPEQWTKVNDRIRWWKKKSTESDDGKKNTIQFFSLLLMKTIQKRLETIIRKKKW